MAQAFSVPNPHLVSDLFPFPTLSEEERTSLIQKLPGSAKDKSLALAAESVSRSLDLLENERLLFLKATSFLRQCAVNPTFFAPYLGRVVRTKEAQEIRRNPKLRSALEEVMPYNADIILNGPITGAS